MKQSKLRRSSVFPHKQRPVSRKRSGKHYRFPRSWPHTTFTYTESYGKSFSDVFKQWVDSMTPPEDFRSTVAKVIRDLYARFSNNSDVNFEFIYKLRTLPVKITVGELVEIFNKHGIDIVHYSANSVPPKTLTDTDVSNLPKNPLLVKDKNEVLELLFKIHLDSEKFAVWFLIENTSILIDTFGNILANRRAAKNKANIES